MSNGKKSAHEGSAGQNMFDQWLSWYETTCKPVFNVPQFGLTRYYQEHTYQSMDKYHQFQGTLASFLDLLLQPVNKAFMDSGKSFFESSGNKAEMKEVKDFYTQWVSTLEKGYMELFRSPDYTQCLNKTMQSFNDFVISHQKVMEDALKALPIPTNSDMDGLYKELYELKKRVRELEEGKVMH